MIPLPYGADVLLGIIEQKHLSQGMDGWWLDATEPERGIAVKPIKV